MKKICKPLRLSVMVCLIIISFFVNNLCAQNIQNYAFSKVGRYENNTTDFYTPLDMAYASSKIRNPKAWSSDLRDRKLLEIDLVFSGYPVDSTTWITPYESLLAKRISNVKALIGNVPDTLHWNIILQTDCESEEEAKKMYHGAIVKFDVKLTPQMRQSLVNMRDIILGKVGFPDSTVFRTFNRNSDWDSMLVINDWTGSMYSYGAQAVLWHRLNFKRRAIRHFVFFNDGNQMPNEDKAIGATGGIFQAPAHNVYKMIRVMRQVMLSGHGGDMDENDLEAVLYGQDNFDDVGEIVLVADNKSNVRDMELLSKVKQPIRIILCGAINGKPIHPHYLEIARSTGGSVHTIEEDIVGLGDLPEGKKVELMGIEYEVKGGKLMPNF